MSDVITTYGEAETFEIKSGVPQSLRQIKVLRAAFNITWKQKVRKKRLYNTLATGEDKFRKKT